MSRIIAPQWVNRRKRGEGRPRNEARRLARGAKEGLRVDPDSLIALFDARDLDLSDTDPVSSWPDASPAGNDLSQGTGAAQPTYRATGLNSLPGVEFDGSDDFLAGSFGSELNSPSGPPQVSSWLLVHAVASPADNQYFFGAGNSGASAEFYYVKGDNTDYEHIINGAALDHASAGISSSAHVMVCLRAAEWCSFRVDGKSLGRPHTANTDTNTYDQFSLGNLHRTTDDFFSDPTVGIAGVWSSLLTLYDVARLERWAADAYDITLAYD